MNPRENRATPSVDPITGTIDRSFNNPNAGRFEMKSPYPTNTIPDGRSGPERGYAITSGKHYISATEGAAEAALIRTFDGQHGLKVIYDNGADEIVLGKDPPYHYESTVYDVVKPVLFQAGHREGKDPSYSKGPIIEHFYQKPQNEG